MQNPHLPKVISLGWLRALVTLAVWGAAACLVLAVAAVINVGPVVLTLSHNHGVHAADILVAIVAAMGATIATVLVYLFIPSAVLAREPRRVGKPVVR